METKTEQFDISNTVMWHVELNIRPVFNIQWHENCVNKLNLDLFSVYCIEIYSFSRHWSAGQPTSTLRIGRPIAKMYQPIQGVVGPSGALSNRDFDSF